MVAKFCITSAFLFASAFMEGQVTFDIRTKIIDEFFDVTGMLRLYFNITVNSYLVMILVYKGGMDNLNQSRD